MHNTKWNGIISKFGLFPKALAFSLILFAAALVPAQAADLSGKVTILEEGSQNPLSDASNVVVFLDTVKGNRDFKPPLENPTMASQDMSFVPMVLPILAGTTVSFPNEDDMLHNVFSLSKTKAFDLGSYGLGQGRTVTFDKTGLVKIYCNIHENMKAYILVLGNPYFTLTDKDGGYRLKNVPPGVYTLVCWYHGPSGKEAIVTENKKVRVGTEAAPSGDFKIVIGAHSAQHKNKWGMYYDDY